MQILNGSIHTTQTPPPLSFYNTLKSFFLKDKFLCEIFRRYPLWNGMVYDLSLPIVI
jgi:hypothetical protein